LLSAVLTSCQIQKRELTLVDKSEYSVRLTLWGKQAEEYNADDNVVIAFKGVKVGDFGGRSLSMYSSSTMSINPDIEETFMLRGWFDAIGTDKSFQSHTNAFGPGAGSLSAFDRKDIRNLNEVKMSGVGMSDKGAENFSTRATIMHIKSDNLSYPACPTQGCNKKVTEMGTGWRCEKCDRSFEKPEYRYIISMAVADWSGQAWLQGFNDAGIAVFGHTADELAEIKVGTYLSFFLALTPIAICL
jgi:replication factor A1